MPLMRKILKASVLSAVSASLVLFTSASPTSAMTGPKYDTIVLYYTDATYSTSTGMEHIFCTGQIEWFNSAGIQQTGSAGIKTSYDDINQEACNDD